MKTRLNLTIDDHLLTSMKTFAEKHRVSVSELVENYFRSVTKPARRKNIVQLIDKLEKPVIDPKADLKEKFYKDQSSKYGF